MPQDIAADNPARKIINKFNGIRPMSAKTGIAASTIQYWWETGKISASFQELVLEKARANRIALRPADFFSAASKAA